ncbi:unnamed protein product [Adineta ricciae]|uniref:Peptidase C14 caspase domain-containing protein n=1 Tax=Adineta ricciae TaxID=249248 RepID=A0A815LQH6_ADIRI|nr:unnamed protein product [Adineta ricciae]CAF1406321.1 unnamed protein product [Adineta ricciae]
MERSAKTSHNYQKLALIIGNGNYHRSNNQLSKSIINAVELSTILKRLNFKITLYIDVRTSEELLGNVEKFAKNIKDNDLVSFYYSGHANQVNKQNYLIPIYDDRIYTDRDVLDIGCNFDSIFQRLLEKTSSHTTVCILDCCKPYWRIGKSESRGVYGGRGLYEIQPIERTLIQLSCAANKTSRDDLFSKKLLKHIAKENIDVRDLFQLITNDVLTESNQMQEPLTINGIKQHEPVYLNKMMINTNSRVRTPNIAHNAKWKYTGLIIAGGKNYKSTMDKLYCPQGLCMSRDNQSILIADSLNHRIMLLNRRTKSLQILIDKNRNGYEYDQLSEPSDVICDIESKRLIISDYKNRRVLQWCPRSSTDLQIIKDNIRCRGLAMDDEGSLYISDTERHEVRRYNNNDREGTVVAGGNGQGNHLNQLNHPTYVFVDRDQSVYVSDSWNDRVMKWEKDMEEGIVVAGNNDIGNNLTQLNCPAGIVVDLFGTVYVADHWNNRVMRWYNGASHGDVIIGNSPDLGNTTKLLNGPEGLAFDGDGNLLIADSYNHRILQFDIRLT